MFVIWFFLTTLAAPWASPTVIEEFNELVEQYVDLRKKTEESLPPLGKKEEDPAEIIEHEKAVAAGIRAQRAKAQRGDIFTPRVRAFLVKQIEQALKSKDGQTARAMILGEGNPRSPASPARVDLRVNGAYPSAAPLSTVPPSVLLALPTLPKGLEFRFVGRHLILYDVKANLIVDILQDVIR